MAQNMKTLLQILFAISTLLLGTASGESSLTKEQVVKMGRIILAVPENKEYKDVFWDDQPEYNTKTKLWAYKNGWPRTPGGPAYTFEIRDADGFYRLAWLTSRKSSSGYERFHIQPSIRKKLVDLVKTFRKP